jgi:hypothetical protein
VQAEVAVHPGELLRAPALPEVYWIDDQGRKRWIASPDVQQKCAFGATRTVPEGTLQKIADGPDITGCEDGSPTSDQPAVQAGEVVKGSTQPAIYVIDDRGRKRWIPTEEVRTSCGYTDIRSVPESLIRRLPDGPELTACAASEDRG